MRFYRVTLEEIDGWLAEDEEMLWQAITVLEAQEMLMGVKVSSYPYLKEADQDKVHRSLHKLAYPDVEKRSITAEEMARLLNG